MVLVSNIMYDYLDFVESLPLRALPTLCILHTLHIPFAHALDALKYICQCII